MADRQKTVCCSRWRSLKLEISFEWGTIKILDDNITSNVLKFGNDTKVFRKVNTDCDKQYLLNDVDKLVKWSEKWQMLLNVWKCKCLHTGHGNLDINYNMGDTVLYSCKRKGLRNKNKC